MAAPRIIVVGGGLAGLSAVIKIAEAGGTVDLFSIVPVKRSHSVCAQGGINAAKNLKGEGDTTWQALRRHHLRRRLSGQPDAGEGDVRGRAGDHRPAGPHGRALQPHSRGAAGLPPLRRHALQPHRLCRRDDRAAVALRARRAGAPLRVRRQGEEVRGLGVSLRGDRLQGRGARHHGARPADDGAAQLPRRCSHSGDRRHRRDLRQEHQLRGLHRLGAIGGLPAGRLLRQRRVHPGASRRAFPAKTSCG